MNQSSPSFLHGMAKKAKITTKAQLVKYLVKQGLTEKQANAQLAKGYKVELEHTDNPEIAAVIAADHLVEFPTYYTALASMEKQLEQKHNKANIGKALALGAASFVSRSVASRSSNPIVKAVARGISVGTAVGSIGALMEESPSKSSTRQYPTSSTVSHGEILSAIEQVKELPEREKNVIASSVEGEAFIAFAYDESGRPTVYPKEVQYVAFIDVDRDYSDNFAAQSIRDKIGNNWKRITSWPVPYSAIDNFVEDKPKDFKGEPKWFKRVKVINNRKKSKAKSKTKSKSKANRAEAAVPIQPLYFQPIPHGLLFNYENVKTAIENEGLSIVDAKWEPAADKKIHEIKLIIEPKDVNKMKKIEAKIDDNIQATKADKSGTRSIIVQAMPSGDLLFIVESGISRVLEDRNEEIGI